VEILPLYIIKYLCGFRDILTSTLQRFDNRLIHSNEFSLHFLNSYDPDTNQAFVQILFAYYQEGRRFFLENNILDTCPISVRIRYAKQ
jgi:hypothetical protein